MVGIGQEPRVGAITLNLSLVLSYAYNLSSSYIHDLISDIAIPHNYRIPLPYALLLPRQF